jgi:ABC-type glutathione transport system ATPase component
VRNRADELLDLVNLDPKRVLRAFPHELSGGMKQRVLIAMSLLLGPQLLILDEPTTALDILTQRAILDLLGELRKKLGFAMIFISHDLSIAAELADRMITMYAGKIVERASVSDMFYRPAIRTPSHCFARCRASLVRSGRSSRSPARRRISSAFRRLPVRAALSVRDPAVQRGRAAAARRRHAGPRRRVHPLEGRCCEGGQRGAARVGEARHEQAHRARGRHAIVRHALRRGQGRR